jgi:hypothetical protein
VTLLDTHPRGLMAVRDGDNWIIDSEFGDDYPGSWVTAVAGLDQGFVGVGADADVPFSIFSCGSTNATRADSRDAPTLGHDGDNAVSHELADFETAQAWDAQVVTGVRAADVTDAAGLTLSAMTYGAVAYDFNGDSWQDLFINRHISDTPLFYMGGPEGFALSTTDWPMRDRHECVAANLAGDNRPDLYCVVGGGRGTRINPNELTLSVGTPDAYLGTSEAGLNDAFGRGRNVALLNLDRDDKPDLVVTNEPERVDSYPSVNRVYRNLGDGRFEWSTQPAFETSAGGQCLATGDIDGDGDDDVALCSLELTAKMKAGARIFVNDNGILRDATKSLGIVPMHDLDMKLADFNGDGKLDLAQMSASRLRISLGGRNGFTGAAEIELAHSVHLGIGDANGDGLPDIYVVQQSAGNANQLMLINGGAATSFSPIAIPEPGAGTADDVVTLDYDHNGLDDFLVTNGRSGHGPLKLIAFFPQS